MSSSTEKVKIIYLDINFIQTLFL